MIRAWREVVEDARRIRGERNTIRTHHATYPYVATFSTALTLYQGGTVLRTEHYLDPSPALAEAILAEWGYRMVTDWTHLSEFIICGVTPA